MNKKVLILIERWGDMVRVRADDGVDVLVMDCKTYTRKRRKDKNSHKDVEKEYFVPFEPKRLSIRKWSDGFYSELIRHGQSARWQQDKRAMRDERKEQRGKLRGIDLLESLPKIVPIKEFKLIKQPNRSTYRYMCTIEVQRKKIITVMLVMNYSMSSCGAYRLKMCSKNSAGKHAIEIQQKHSYATRFGKLKYVTIKSIAVLTQRDKEQIMEELLGNS